MTRLRAELVCEASLHKTALELGLGSYMRLGRGEEHTGGRERPSILADMVEAIIAAMYLDSGMDQARRFILERILHDVEFGDSHRSADYKTQLQELVQRRSNQVITYRLVGESGPDHDKTFTFEVLINGVVSGQGSGKTKKEAEQMAACKALESVSGMSARAYIVPVFVPHWGCPHACVFCNQRRISGAQKPATAGGREKQPYSKQPPSSPKEESGNWRFMGAASPPSRFLSRRRCWARRRRRWTGARSTRSASPPGPTPSTTRCLNASKLTAWRPWSWAPSPWTTRCCAFRSAGTRRRMWSGRRSL